MLKMGCVKRLPLFTVMWMNICAFYPVGCELLFTWYWVHFVAVCAIRCCSCQSFHMRSRYVNWSASCSYRWAQWAAVCSRCQSWIPCAKHSAEICHSSTRRLRDLMPVVCMLCLC